MHRSIAFSRRAVSLLLLTAALPVFAQRSGTVTVSTAATTVRVQMISDSIVHVMAAPNAVAAAAFSEHPSIAVVSQRLPVGVRVATTAAATTLSTARLKIRVDAVTGAVAFADAVTGLPILSEAARHIESAVVSGEKTSHIRQQWQASPDESLYGLGQQQLGIVDIKGYDLDLWQHNTNVVVPYLSPAAATASFGTTPHTPVSAICAPSSLSPPISSST